MPRGLARKKSERMKIVISMGWVEMYSEIARVVGEFRRLLKKRTRSWRVGWRSVERWERESV